MKNSNTGNIQRYGQHFQPELKNKKNVNIKFNNSNNNSRLIIRHLSTRKFVVASHIKMQIWRFQYFWEPIHDGVRRRILWNPNVHHRTHKNPPPVLFLSRSIQSMSHHPSRKIYFDIIFPPTPGTSAWSFALRPSHQHQVCTSPVSHTCYMPRPSRSSSFYHPNNIWTAVQIIKILVM